MVAVVLHGAGSTRTIRPSGITTAASQVVDLLGIRILLREPASLAKRIASKARSRTRGSSGLVTDVLPRQGSGRINRFLPPALPPLLTETHRYDRSGRNSSMKSKPASPCQRGGRRFEPGLVLQHSRAPSRSCAEGLFVCGDSPTLSAAEAPFA